jgi:hypothetical protein
MLLATFTSIRNTKDLEATASSRYIQHAVQNIPILPLACVLYCIGLGGSCYL